MSKTQTPATPETHDRVIVNRALLREFRLLPGLIRGVEPGDKPRAEMVGEHCADFTTSLRDQLAADEELLWPKLAERSPQHGDFVASMRTRGETLNASVREIGSLLPPFVVHVESDVRDRLGTVVEQVSADLTSYLTDHERHALPLVEQHLTGEEWSKVGQDSVRGVERDKMMIYLGALLEDASEDEQATYLGRLPIGARFAWKMAGRRGYQRYVTLVRGEADPE